jgi:hypothetical protein
MTYPAYIREKARKLRTERKLSLDQIAECLALPKTTVYYGTFQIPRSSTGIHPPELVHERRERD